MYRIAPDPSWIRKKDEVVSVDRLKIFYDDEVTDVSKHQPPAEDADLSMTGDEYAETVHIQDSDEDTDDAGVQPPPVRPPSPPRPPTPPRPLTPPRPPSPPPVIPPPAQPVRVPQPVGRGAIPKKGHPRPTSPATSPDLPKHIRPGGYLAREYTAIKRHLQQQQTAREEQQAARQQRYLRQHQQDEPPSPTDAGGKGREKDAAAEAARNPFQPSRRLLRSLVHHEPRAAEPTDTGEDTGDPERHEVRTADPDPFRAAPRILRSPVTVTEEEMEEEGPGTEEIQIKQEPED